MADIATAHRGRATTEYPQKMTLKSSLTALRNIDAVDRATFLRLRELSITTLEELLGAAHAEPATFAEYLHMTVPQFSHWLTDLETHLEPETRQRLRQSPQRHPLGAWDPQDHP